MSPESLVAIVGGVLAIVGAFWRAMSILAALERKIDAVSAKLDLHVLDRLGRVETEVKELYQWQREVDGQLAQLPSRATDRPGA